MSYLRSVSVSREIHNHATGDPKSREMSVPVPEREPGEGFAHNCARRFGVSVFDQFLFSGVQFCLNIALARWLNLEDYGLFTVLSTLFLIALGFHNSFIVEPYAVFAPRQAPPKLPLYETAVNWLHWIVFGTAGALGAAACWILLDGEFRRAALIFCFSCPIAYYLWHRRRACYVRAKPEGVLVITSVYAVSVLSIAFVAHRFGLLDSATVFVVLALASTAGLIAAHWFGRKGRKSTRPKSADLREAARLHWKYGKWAAGTTLLYVACTHFQALYAAARLGRESAGTLRAGLNFSLPMNQVVTAASLFALPMLARRIGAGDSRQAIRLARVVSVSLGCLCVLGATLLLLFRGWICEEVYGGKFSAFALMLPLLAIVPLSSAIAAGDGMLVRAANRPSLQFRISVLTGFVGLASAILLIEKYGVWGAALSMAITYSATALTQLFVGFHVRRSLLENDTAGKFQAGRVSPAKEDVAQDHSSRGQGKPRPSNAPIAPLAGANSSSPQEGFPLPRNALISRCPEAGKCQ